MLLGEEVKNKRWENRIARDGDCHLPLHTSLARFAPARLREVSFVRGAAESRKVGVEIRETVRLVLSAQ